MLKNLPRRALRKIGFEIIKIDKHTGNKGDLLRLSQLGLNQLPIKLHFGCGPRVLKGWVNIDLSYEPFENYLQYYTDKHYPESIRGGKSDFYEINLLKTGLPLPDNSVDLIFHVQRINTPNLLASMRDNSTFGKGKDGVFTNEWDTWHHYSIVSPAILKEMAMMVGYTDIKFNSKNNSIAVNLLPSEYRPDENDRPAPDSNVFADLIK